MMTCPNCQAENQAARFCTSCGVQLPGPATTGADAEAPESELETAAGPTCAQCGNPTGDNAFCTNCGAPQRAAQAQEDPPADEPAGQYGYLFDPGQPSPAETVMYQPTPPQAPPPVVAYPGHPLQPPVPGRRRRGLVTLAVVLAAVLVLSGAGVAGAVLLKRDKGDDRATGATTQEPSDSTSEDIEIDPDPTTEETPAPDAGGGAEGDDGSDAEGDGGSDAQPSSPSTEPTARVLRLPAGKFCRDLSGAGFSYAEAVAYWKLHGRPDRMDADVDDIPCETVYPINAVRAVWGAQLENATTDVSRLPAGMPCAQLAEYGVEYQYVPDYWGREGYPSSMDRDGNGKPCEYEYPPGEVRAYFGN